MANNDTIRAAKWRKRALTASKKVYALKAEVDKLSRWKKRVRKSKVITKNKNVLIEKNRSLQREVELWRIQTFRLRDEVDSLKKKIRSARTVLA